jgi:hypothetical protein
MTNSQILFGQLLIVNYLQYKRSIRQPHILSIPFEILRPKYSVPPYEI